MATRGSTTSRQRRSRYTHRCAHLEFPSWFVSKWKTPISADIVPMCDSLVIWVERTGFQNALDIFRNGPSSERFRCLSPVSANGPLSCPANVKSPLSPSAGSLRAAASFRLSTAWRADRTDHLASPDRRSVVRPWSHCVAKPLAQLIGSGENLD